jgi:hypothetical protein
MGPGDIRGGSYGLLAGTVRVATGTIALRSFWPLLDKMLRKARKLVGVCLRQAEMDGNCESFLVWVAPPK